MKLTLHSNQQPIQIASKPFAGGGEGNLYRILEPKELRSYVVKIYHKEKRTPLREQKMHYLLKHPPAQLQSEMEHPPVVWPVDLVYDGSTLMGFLMPFIQGEKLELLCTPKLPRKSSKTWARFAFDNPEAMQLRLRLCFNIATALYQVHSTGRYVLVDLKPDNVVIQPNGLVSLVDMDSVEVVEDEQVLFPAPVATPEYTPPEHYHPRSHQSGVDTSWDHFSMAVIFYKLLLGIHPFAASALPPYDQAAGLQDMIQYGLFVHSPARQASFQTIPHLHQQFHHLESSLKELFLLCFEGGHHNPFARPTAEDWCLHFFNSIEHSEEEKERFGSALFAKTRKLGLKLSLPSKLLTPSPYRGEVLEKAMPNGLSLLSQDPPSFALSIPEPKPNEVILIKQLSSTNLLILIPLFFILLGMIGGIAILLLPIFVILVVPIMYYYQNTPDALVQWDEKVNKFTAELEDFEQELLSIRTRINQTIPKVLPQIAEIVEKVNTGLQKAGEFMRNRDPEVVVLEQAATLNFDELEQKYWKQAFTHPWVSPLDPNKFDNLYVIYQYFYRAQQQQILALQQQFQSDGHSPIYEAEQKAIDKKYKALALELANKMKLELDAYQELAVKDKAEYWELVELDADLKSHCFNKLLPAEAGQYATALWEWLKTNNFTSMLAVTGFQSVPATIYLEDNKTLSLLPWMPRIPTLLDRFKNWKKEIDTLILSYNKICTETDQKLANTEALLTRKQEQSLKQLDFQAAQELRYLHRQLTQQILEPKMEEIRSEYAELLDFIKNLIAEKDKHQDRLIEKIKQQYKDILDVCRSRLSEEESFIQAEEDAFRLSMTKALSAPVRKNLQRYQNSLEQMSATKTRLAQAKFECARYVKEQKSLWQWLFGGI